MDEIDQIRTPVEEDTTIEAAVLRQLLALHPIQIGFDELLRELDLDGGDFSQRDAAERAVRDLSSAGLLRRSGELIVPSRAALRCDRLLGG